MASIRIQVKYLRPWLIVRAKTCCTVVQLIESVHRLAYKLFKNSSTPKFLISFVFEDILYYTGWLKTAERISAIRVRSYGVKRQREPLNPSRGTVP